MIQDEIMKLQAYKMFEGEDTVYVERDDVLEVLKQEPCEDAINREWLKTAIHNFYYGLKHTPTEEDIQAYIDAAPPVTPQPKTGHWNNHQIACMLADLFGDACACNYNGIDEWLSELCDFKDTCCPNPVGVACWEQFLKHRAERRTDE